MAENSKIEFRYSKRSADRLGISEDVYLAHRRRGEKWCARCRAWHSVQEFGIDRSNTDGLLAYCRKSTHRTIRKPWAGGRRKGGKHTAATRARMAAARKGTKNHNWKGGITAITRRERQNALYQQWRRVVLKRDNRTCQHCGEQPERPHVHHIKPLKTHPDLKLKISNGVTLCPPCHRAVHAKGAS